LNIKQVSRQRERTLIQEEKKSNNFYKSLKIDERYVPSLRLSLLEKKRSAS
jgi:hypothetical protein